MAEQIVGKLNIVKQTSMGPIGSEGQFHGRGKFKVIFTLDPNENVFTMFNSEDLVGKKNLQIKAGEDGGEFYLYDNGSRERIAVKNDKTLIGVNLEDGTSIYREPLEIVIKDKNEKKTIVFNSDHGVIIPASNEKKLTQLQKGSGKLIMKKSGGGYNTIEMDGKNATLNFFNIESQPMIQLDGRPGTSEAISVANTEGKKFFIVTKSGRINVGSSNVKGSVFIAGSNGKNSIILNDYIGDGMIKVMNKNTKTGLRLLAGEGIKIFDINGEETVKISNSGSIVLGGNGKNGWFILKDNAGEEKVLLSDNSSNGEIGLRNENGKQGVVINASHGLKLKNIQGKDIAKLWSSVLRLGGNGEKGSIGIEDEQGDSKVLMDTSNHSGHIGLFNIEKERTIHLDGEKGDIVLENADFAEEFDVLAPAEAKRGSLMVLNQSGQLEVCTKEYDSKVVGVVAGAGKFNPGIVMDKKGNSKNRLPISILGKAECLVDAQKEGIKVGDMLTTSSVPGFAMKVTDKSKAFGTVIGKALAPLEKGKGLISVLINIQ
jgi:hypothetical protein